MTLHVIGIFDSLPHVKHGGGGIHSYGLLRALRHHGFRVTALVLPQSLVLLGSRRAEDTAHLKSCGIDVVEILLEGAEELWVAGLEPNPIKVTARPSPETIAQLVAQITDRIRADAAVTYHWPGIQGLSFVHAVPKLGIVVDPMHLPFLLRRKFTLQYASDEERATLFMDAAKEDDYVRSTERNMVRMLQSCDASVCFAAHHAEQYAALGASNCRYLPCALPDPQEGGPLPVDRSGKFRILHIGHLRGIATLTGVDLLAYGILPELDRRLPPGSFEIHIVGGYVETLPPKLRAALDHPAVVFRGQVVPPDDEFLRAHVVLVPTPAELGMRVRIATAFSYGACVVAHEANACGIPEMEHGENCLIGADGISLAEHCVSIFHDPALRVRLEGGGRRTFERFFTYETGGKGIAELLTSLVEQRRTASSASSSPTPQNVTVTIDQAMDMASRLEGEGRLAEAEGLHRMLLKAHPTHPSSRHSLARVLLKLGRLGEALEEACHAILLSPGLLDAYLTLGAAFEARGNSAGAAAAYRRALSFQADFAPARERLVALR